MPKEFSTDYTMLKKNVLSRWVNHTISPQEFLKRAEKLGIITDSTAYTTVLLYLIYDKESTSIHKLHELCYGFICHDPHIMCFDDMYGNFVLIFSHEASPNRDEIVNHRLDELMDYLNTLRLGLKMTVGATVDSYKDLPHSYDTANKLFNYFLIYPHHQQLNYNHIEEKKAFIAKSFSIDQEGITNRLLSGTREELITYIDHVFQQIIDRDDITPEHIRSASYELLLHLHHNLCHFSSLQHELMERHTALIHQLHTIKDHYLYSHALKDYLLSVMDLLQEKQLETTPVVGEILRYIAGHYNDDLSLKSLSSTFNMNTTYLGQLFKTEVGCSFNVYVNNYRLDIAKELLTKTYEKTSDIARKIGYQDPNYFYRLFKKRMGISPTTYRHLHE